MLLFAFVLVIVCGCLLAAAIAVKFNPEARGTYERIKKKIFWNAFIRYVLQSTLKTQVGAGAVIAVTLGLQAQHSDEPQEEKTTAETLKSLAVPIGMVCFFNIAPFVFMWVLKRNKENLDTPETRAKYG